MSCFLNIRREKQAHKQEQQQQQQAQQQQQQQQQQKKKKVAHCFSVTSLSEWFIVYSLKYDLSFSQSLVFMESRITCFVF